MKRIKTIAVVLVATLLCFAATAMATEFSFYDSVNDWIVTAYSEANEAGGTYSVYLNILDPNTNLSADPALILLTKAGERQASASNGDYLICNCAVSDKISLAHKSAAGLSDIFVLDHHFDDAQPPQDYVKVHNAIQLTGFDLPDPANISVSGSGSFGNVNVGSSSTNIITVSNTGEAALTISSINVNNVTGTSFSRNGGTCGSTIAGGGSCTIGVKFEPGAATSYSGTLAILSDDGDQSTVNVSLTGTGVAVPTGTIDIKFPAYVGIDAAGVICNNLPFSVKVKVTNGGTQPSGPFAVKIYLSLNKTVESTDTYLGTWNVGNLNAGETLEYIFPDIVVSGLSLHMSYFFLAHADANNNIPNETNENNNVFYRVTTVAR